MCALENVRQDPSLPIPQVIQEIQDPVWKQFLVLCWGTPTLCHRLTGMSVTLLKTVIDLYLKDPGSLEFD